MVLKIDEDEVSNACTGCGKPTDNKWNKCWLCRRTKCAVPGCFVMFTQIKNVKYCSDHAKKASYGKRCAEESPS